MLKLLKNGATRILEIRIWQGTAAFKIAGIVSTSVIYTP
jgi:hypothetical protein